MSNTYRHNTRYKSYTTLKGLSKLMYRTLKSSSKNRGHTPPNFSYEEFYRWLTIANNFEQLFSFWVLSGYDKNFRPSVDRVDNFKSYSFDNMTLTTWEVNRSKSYKDKLEGKNSRDLTPVCQYDLEGNFIFCYASINIAQRITGIYNIHQVMTGKRKTAGGYIWRRK